MPISSSTPSPPRTAAASASNFYRENTLPLPLCGKVLYPDSAFELHTRDGQQFNFLVELDCGTERIRSEKDTDSWQRKVRLYNILQDRNYPDRFRVLVVTTRCSGRLQSILALAGQHATNPHRSLIYGVHLPAYLADANAVCSPCFRNHRDESVTLLPSAVLPAATPAASSPLDAHASPV